MPDEPSIFSLVQQEPFETLPSPTVTDEEDRSTDDTGWSDFDVYSDTGSQDANPGIGPSAWHTALISTGVPSKTARIDERPPFRSFSLYIHQSTEAPSPPACPPRGPLVVVAVSTSRRRKSRAPAYDSSWANSTAPDLLAPPRRSASGKSQAPWNPRESAPFRSPEYPDHGSENIGTRPEMLQSLSPYPLTNRFQQATRTSSSNILAHRFKDANVVPVSSRPPRSPLPLHSVISSPPSPSPAMASKSSLEDLRTVTEKLDGLSMDLSIAADHSRLSDMVFRNREDMEWLDNDIDVYFAPDTVVSHDAGSLPDSLPAGHPSSGFSSLPGKAVLEACYRTESDGTQALRQTTSTKDQDLLDSDVRRSAADTLGNQSTLSDATIAALVETKSSPAANNETGEPICEATESMEIQSFRRSCSVVSMGSKASQESAKSDETESSFTGSLWLLSEHSNEPETLGEEHPFFPLKPVALRKVLEDFRAWQACPMGPPNSSSAASPLKASGDNQSKESSRKRSRKSDSEQSPNNDGTDPSKNQKTANKRQKISDKKLTFACPFSKKDPMKHRDCYRFTLNRIRDVKQHLVRCHRVPLYCPRCMDTFPDEELRDIHIRDVDCPRRQFVRLDCVTDSQRGQLSKKVPSNISVENQCGRHLPSGIAYGDPAEAGAGSSVCTPLSASPYIDNDLLQDITLYQDYLTNHGPRILSDILTSRGAVTWHLPNEERDLAAFQNSIFEEGLRVIFKQWASQNGISVPEPAAQSISVSVDQLMPADGDERSTLPMENPQASSIFTDDRQQHDAASSSEQLTVPSELDLEHLGASLGDSEDMWAEDFDTPQLASRTTEEEGQLMRIMADSQSEQQYSSWAWSLFH
ncbi:hypothetical protein CSOJ01_14824 [Colletotrichum sojae]|uniref:C2H2-type domain-containing protein n=1 Tax=Colletotrichum sojae TaxID=2175907 RepID=A0A8H6MJH3_9PEZI|nr:hypothetical protein CSOJ01_14824 [Colletotrichum sojae]